MAQMEKTTVYLPQALERELKQVAQREGRPMAALIRDALQRYLTDRPRPMPTSIGMGADGKIGAGDAKQWVREQWGRRSGADA